MKRLIFALFLYASFFVQAARAEYPIHRVEGIISGFGKTGDERNVEVLAGEKTWTIILGSATSVRVYEMGLRAEQPKIGDEVCLFEKGKSRVGYSTISGTVSGLKPLSFRTELYLLDSEPRTKKRTFAVGDYATAKIEKINRPVPTTKSNAKKSELIVCYGPTPTHIQTITINKPERIEFTRYLNRKLSDLSIGQNVSIYFAELPGEVFRTRGVAILKHNSVETKSIATSVPAISHQ